MYNNYSNFAAGDIVFLNRKGTESNIFSKLQRFFTGMPYTHTAIIIGDIFSETSVLSAEKAMVIHPIKKYFNESDTDIEIWKSSADKYKYINLGVLYNNYSGAPYGYLQTLWFAYRWFMGLFGIDVRKRQNPSAKTGIICSELIYDYLMIIATSSTDEILLQKLQQYNPDTIHVGDIHNIVSSLPQAFSKIYDSKIK